MKTQIVLTEKDNHYWPISPLNLHLMQHCMNEDLACVNKVGFDKLLTVAEAHGWEVITTKK